MDESGHHRRRFPRIRSEHLILVKKVGVEALEEVTKTEMISPGGCLIVSEESIPEGTLIELTLAVVDKLAKAVGKVLYEIPQEDGTYHIGVEFTSISPADKEAIESLFGVQGTVIAGG
jgi:c-di-GMP-binding flagellar brake protein YcgR